MKIKLTFLKVFLICLPFNSFTQDSINIDTSNIDTSLIDSPHIDTTIIDTSFYISGADDYNLILAVESGYAKEVIRLLNKGFDINYTTADGVTPLMYAVQNQDSVITKILVLNGADIDKKPDSGITALINSVINNNLYITEYLIRKGADINITDSKGNTPLMYAAAYGHFIILDMLLYYEADAEIKNIYGTNALMIALFYGDYEISSRLIETGIDINISDNAGLSAIHYAVQNGHQELTELLADNGADIEAKTLSGHSPLAIAVDLEQFEMVKLLTEKGADVNNKISFSENPVSLACSIKNKDIRNYLLENKGRRNLLPYFNQYIIGLNIDCNFKDLLAAINFGVRDKKYNISLFCGTAVRPRAMRILEQESENLAYQYWERRMAFFAGAEKKVSIIKLKDQLKLGINLVVNELFTFGSYRGSSNKPESRFLFVPETGIFWEDNLFTININYEYLDLDLYKVSPGRVDISFIIRINRRAHKYLPPEIDYF
jgi:ankyrin repeat protein